MFWPEPSKQKADTTDAEDEELLLASDDDGEGTGQQSQTTERTLRKLPFNHVPNVSRLYIMGSCSKGCNQNTT